MCIFMNDVPNFKYSLIDRTWLIKIIKYLVITLLLRNPVFEI